MPVVRSSPSSARIHNNHTPGEAFVSFHALPCSSDRHNAKRTCSYDHLYSRATHFRISAATSLLIPTHFVLCICLLFLVVCYETLPNDISRCSAENKQIPSRRTTSTQSGCDRSWPWTPSGTRPTMISKLPCGRTQEWW